MSAPGPKTMRAVERVREGESCLAAAKAEGLNVTSVWRVCKRLGIPVRRRGERATNAAAAAAAKLAHERGLNARQAAEATGASERTIYRHMHRLAAVERAVNLVLRGKSVNGAACATGASRWTVQDRVNRARAAGVEVQPEARRVDAVAIVDAAVARLREVAA